MASRAALKLVCERPRLEIAPPSDAFVIGRGTAADGVDVRIDERSVGRVQARISWNNGWTIADLDSPSGTYVNGVVVSSARRLRDGDEIRVGKVILRVELTELTARVIRA